MKTLGLKQLMTSPGGVLEVIIITFFLCLGVNSISGAVKLMLLLYVTYEAHLCLNAALTFLCLNSF